MATGFHAVMASTSSPGVTSLGAVHHPTVNTALESMFRAAAPYFMTDSGWTVSLSTVSHAAEISMLEIVNPDGDHTVFSVWACSQVRCALMGVRSLPPVPVPR